MTDRIIHYGNFESNKLFINKTGLLDKKKKILEIGSGKGAMVNYLKKEGYNIIGTEISKEFIKESKEIFGNLPIIEMSGDDIKFKDNTFDIIISFDVFEHIPDSDKHLQEVKRVLKSNGYYLLQTPNKITNTPWEIVQQRHLTNWKKDHCSLHTYWEINKRFKKNNFNINFINIPITNDFSLSKVKRNLGNIGLILFKIFNPDKMPYFLKTNFYIITKAIK